MPDYKERVTEMLEGLLNVAPGRSNDPLFTELSSIVRKWGDHRQRTLERLTALVLKAQTDATEPLAREWQDQISQARLFLKVIFSINTSNLKLPQWAQNWMMSVLIAEDHFLNGLLTVQTIELIGKIRNEKMILDVMQEHLSKKWAMLNDQTAPFRSQQMQAIDEIEKIATAHLDEVVALWRTLTEGGGKIYRKAGEAVDDIEKKTRGISVKEIVISVAKATAAFLKIDADAILDPLDILINSADHAAKMAIAKNDLKLLRVRYYKDNMRDQGYILRLFAEERRLVREYERTNGVKAAIMYQKLADDAASLWVAQLLTDGQKDDAAPIEEFLIAQIGVAVAAITEADKAFRTKHTGLFVEKPSDSTEEALTSEDAFRQRIANLSALDIDEKISRHHESTNRIFEDAVDDAFETVERSIVNLPFDANEVLLVDAREHMLVEARKMHAAVKSVLKEKLKVMIDISTKLGKEFDRSTLEEAFDRRELINAVDR